MEDNTTNIEILLAKTADYGTVSYQLVKLKILDRAANKVSSFLSYLLVVLILSSFMLFLNLGIALWLSEILGTMYLGFLSVAAFYVLLAIIFIFIFRKWVKRICYDMIIRSYKLEENE